MYWIIDDELLLEQLQSKVDETLWPIRLSGSVQMKLTDTGEVFLTTTDSNKLSLNLSVRFRVIEFVNPEDDIRFGDDLREWLIQLPHTKQVNLTDRHVLICVKSFEQGYLSAMEHLWKTQYPRQ